MIRQRSVSQNSKALEFEQVRDTKTSQFHRKIVPLHQENSMLKDRLHKMKFQVEDNLQLVIDELDKDLQLKAKLIDFQQLFGLIKAQINKDHEKIDSLQEQIERLQFNLTQSAQQREDECQMYQQSQTTLNEQLQKEKQQFRSEKLSLDEQIKVLTYQNYEKEQELEQMKKQLQWELDQNQELIQKVERTKKFDQELKDKQVQYETTISKLNAQIETDNQVFKNELELQQQKLEAKYRQMIQENKLLTSQVSEMKQNIHQLKQQKESMERTLESNNQKMKDMKAGVISDKQQMSKNEKTIEELQTELTFFKNKVSLDEKREIKLKQQLTQQEDQIQELLQVKNQYNNLRKVLQQEHLVEIEKINIQHNQQLKSLNEQMQIQRVKYEKLLGKQVDIKEVAQYQQKDYSQQYEDPVHIQYVENLELKIENQTQLIKQLEQNIINNNEEYNKEKQQMYNQFAQEKQVLITQQKQDLQRQLAEFEEFKNKLQSDYNYRTQLLTQQFSFQLDQQKQEQKQLQQIIDQSKLSGDEKTKLLEIASEEIMNLRKKYDHDIYEERNTQRQMKHEFENAISQNNSDHQKQIDILKREIENLKLSLSDFQEKDQVNKQKISDLLNEQKQDKSSINQLEFQLNKKQIEIQKLNETIRGLNARISTLLLEVENTKKTYNIFAPSSSNSSHYNLKKLELEIPTDLSQQQRHSSSELKFKPELLMQDFGKKSNRNRSQQGSRQYQIRQMPPV
ncbi:unnamed protein product [Paramecium octaurelia]|uniref:Uncharacterized protein n=1 Tax=Paramecium octaurelia TaxID=43137 RepID=A0A8S1WEE9_PAROT|nr:unnamed protein product [Paramecium octaurelia]